MLHLAALAGLRPWEVYAATEREVEIWVEAYQERQRHQVEILAWVQANLINIHVPKGKPRVRAADLLPKGFRPRAKAVAAPTSVAEAKALARGARDARQAREWWTSPEGVDVAKRLADLALGGQDGGEGGASGDGPADHTPEGGEERAP